MTVLKSSILILTGIILAQGYFSLQQHYQLYDLERNLLQIQQKITEAYDKNQILYTQQQHLLGQVTAYQQEQIVLSEQVKRLSHQDGMAAHFDLVKIQKAQIKYMIQLSDFFLQAAAPQFAEDLLKTAQARARDLPAQYNELKGALENDLHLISEYKRGQYEGFYHHLGKLVEVLKALTPLQHSPESCPSAHQETDLLQFVKKFIQIKKFSGYQDALLGYNQTAIKNRMLVLIEQLKMNFILQDQELLKENLSSLKSIVTNYFKPEDKNVLAAQELISSIQQKSSVVYPKNSFRSLSLIDILSGKEL